MAPTSSRLVLTGGAADLSFRDGTGAKRRVLPGQPFDVDEQTASILLADPNVVPYVEADRSARNDEATASGTVSPEQALGTFTVAKLLELAAELGVEVPKGAKKAELVEAILAATEEKRLADEAAAAAAAASSSGERTTEGDVTPGDDPAASGAGEPGTPPAMPDGSSTGGAIVLGDLPDGARKGQG